MADLEELYREIILDHYRSPRNRGELESPRPLGGTRSAQTQFAPGRDARPVLRVPLADLRAIAGLLELQGCECLDRLQHAEQVLLGPAGHDEPR